MFYEIAISASSQRRYCSLEYVGEEQVSGGEDRKIEGAVREAVANDNFNQGILEVEEQVCLWRSGKQLLLVKVPAIAESSFALLLTLSMNIHYSYHYNLAMLLREYCLSDLTSF